MEADADDVEAHGCAMGPMMTQQFVTWYQTMRARDSASYLDLTNTALIYEARVLRHRAADNFMAERSAAVALDCRHTANMVKSLGDGPACQPRYGHNVSVLIATEM